MNQPKIQEFEYKPDHHLSDPFLTKNADKVLMYLLEVGVSYPTEISQECQLNIESVNKVLHHFKRLKMIKRVMPDRWYPQPTFMSRMNNFWETGRVGYEKLSFYHWWQPTIAGILFIKEKYPNQNKQLSQALFDELTEVNPKVYKETVIQNL